MKVGDTFLRPARSTLSEKQHLWIVVTDPNNENKVLNPASCLWNLAGSFLSCGHKFERLALRPGSVGRGEPNAFFERRVSVQPEANEWVGIRVFQVFCTHYLKGLNIGGVGVRYNPISYFQAELVGLVLVMT